MATKTKKPTGLSITRSGNTYTFKWKIASKDHGGGQKLEYEVYTPNSGQGASPSISNTATSYSITVANVKSISFRVRGKRKKNGNTTYDYSDWASASWTAAVPKTPTLTYKNEGTNKGTITWSCPNDSSDNAVFTGAEYQTCIERNSAASGFWGASVQAKGAAGSEMVIEASADMAAGNFVRWFRIRACGPAGNSPWVTASHAYGAPRNATVMKSQVTWADSSSSRVKVDWLMSHDTQYPIDELAIQYVTAVPDDVSLSAPSTGWSDAIKLDAKLVNDSAVVNIPDVVGDDECMWVRVVADHDGLKSYSVGDLAKVGILKAPTLDAVPNTSTGVVQFTITEETACDVAATAIYFIPEGKPSNQRIVAILPHGTTTGQATVPEVVGATHTCFGAQAFVGYYSGTTISNLKMKSGMTYDSDIPAVAPADVAVVESPLEGSVRVSWAWSWSAASEAEIAWADNEYAWESTNEPSTYRVKDNFATSWIVAGLETDKSWFFRVRLIDTSGDTEVVGPWSEMVSYSLAGNPERPALFLSKSVISPGDTVVARWVYIASGNDEQEYAEICLATYDENTGDPIYGDVIATAGAEQSAEIAREWEADTTYYLALRTTSNTGRQSEWSEVASLLIVPAINISITVSDLCLRYDSQTNNTFDDISTSSYAKYVDDVLVTARSSTVEGSSTFAGSSLHLEEFIKQVDATVETTIDGNVMEVRAHKKEYEFYGKLPSIVSLPFSATITGAGASGTTVMSIVRAENYRFNRPDDNDYDGYSGEIIATKNMMGEGEMTIGLDDIIGHLDDGACYHLIVKAIDTYGQTASLEYPIWVDWETKSFVPEASVEMDP